MESTLKRSVILAINYIRINCVQECRSDYETD